MGFGKRCTRAAGLSIARRLPPAAEVRFDMMRARDIVLFTSRETGRFTYRAVVREKLESKFCLWHQLGFRLNAFGWPCSGEEVLRESFRLSWHPLKAAAETKWKDSITIPLLTP
jgi:hypothetical protein